MFDKLQQSLFTQYPDFDLMGRDLWFTLKFWLSTAGFFVIYTESCQLFVTCSEPVQDNLKDQ